MNELEALRKVAKVAEQFFEQYWRFGRVPLSQQFALKDALVELEKTNTESKP